MLGREISDTRGAHSRSGPRQTQRRPRGGVDRIPSPPPPHESFTKNFSPTDLCTCVYENSKTQFLLLSYSICFLSLHLHLTRLPFYGTYQSPVLSVLVSPKALHRDGGGGRVDTVRRLEVWIPDKTWDRESTLPLSP